MYSRYSIISLCHWSSRPTERSKSRYSVSNRPIWGIFASVGTGSDEPIGGRGPPVPLRRPELQAMSNSLQLASI